MYRLAWENGGLYKMRWVLNRCCIIAFMIILSQGRASAVDSGIAEEAIIDEAEAVNIAFETAYSKTFNRQLEPGNSESDDIKSMDQAHARVSYIKYEQFQPYVKLGITQLEEEIDNIDIAGLGRRNVELDYDLAFSYGAGLSGMFRIANEYLMGYDLQYLRSSHELDAVRHNAQSGFGLKGETLLQEWHGAVWFGRKFDLAVINETTVTLIPYVGGRLSDLKLEVKKELGYTVSEGIVGLSGANKADNKAGIFIGSVFKWGDSWLRLEGRFFDENAVTAAVGYKF